VTRRDDPARSAAGLVAACEQTAAAAAPAAAACLSWFAEMVQALAALLG
jgi:hypothetical protein